MTESKWIGVIVLLVLWSITGCQPLVDEQVTSSDAGVSYEQYTSSDGRISFDVPAGWTVTPFGGAFNLSNQGGWVATETVKPGQKQIDIVMLNAEDMAAMGVPPDLDAEEYASALLQAIDDGSSPFTIDGTRAVTLENGTEAGLLDIASGTAQVLAMAFPADDFALFVSGFTHASEFSDVEPIVQHVVNSIKIQDGATAAAGSDFTVTVIATDAGLQFPDTTGPELPNGLVTFSFENKRADAEFAPLIARLNDGATLDAFNEAVNSDDSMAPLSLITLYGGRYMQPGETFSFATNLIPGEHVLIEMDPNGAGEVSPFIVTAGTNTDAVAFPEADLTLNLLDFAFGLPAIMPAGEHLWHIANDGGQWHEIIVYPVPDDTTVADLVAETVPPWEQTDAPQAGFTFGPMSEGMSVWTTVNLEPGTYAALCFLPDIAGDFAPHVNHGMAGVFIVK